LSTGIDIAGLAPAPEIPLFTCAEEVADAGLSPPVPLRFRGVTEGGRDFRFGTPYEGVDPVTEVRALVEPPEDPEGPGVPETLCERLPWGEEAANFAGVPEELLKD
jgi:hypothetical protein